MIFPSDKNRHRRETGTKKVMAYDLVPGDLVVRSQWIDGEGNVTELRVVLSNERIGVNSQIEWLRIKKCVTHTGFYHSNEWMEVLNER